jgi:hypothetical protein
MRTAVEMFSFDPNPTRAKKMPGPLLLVYFMTTTLCQSQLYPPSHGL